MAVPAHFAFVELAFMAPARVWFDLELIGLVFGLFVLIALGAAIALKSRSLAKPDEDAAMPEHSLAHYQDLFDRGLIDGAEFERIRARLTAQPPAPPADT